MNLEERYSLFLFLQIDPSVVARVFHNPLAWVKEVIPREYLRKGLTVRRVCGALGRHDLLFQVSWDDLAGLTTAGYEILRFLERENPGSLVDMTRILGSGWKARGQSLDEKPQDMPVLALTLLKLNQLESSDERSPLEDEMTVIEAMMKGASEYGLEAEPYSTFSWYEIMCVFRGRNHDAVFEFLRFLRAQFPFLRTYTTPLVDRARTREITTVFRPVILLNSRTDIGAALPRIVERVSHRIDRKHDTSLGDSVLCYPRFGSHDYQVQMPKLKFSVYVDFIQELLGMDELSLNKSTTTWCFSNNLGKSGQIDDSDVVSRTGPFLDLRIEADTLDAELDSVIDRKVLSDCVKLLCLYNRPDYADILPLHPDFLLQPLLSDKVPVEHKLLVLSWIRHGINQRLAGTQLGSMAGIQSGLLEHLGGFQRFILAYESIIQDTLHSCHPGIYQSTWRGMLVFEAHQEFQSIGKQPVKPGNSLLFNSPLKYNPDLICSLLVHECAHDFPMVDYDLMGLEQEAEWKGLLENRSDRELMRIVAPTFFSHMGDVFALRVIGEPYLDLMRTYAASRFGKRREDWDTHQAVKEMLLTECANTDTNEIPKGEGFVARQVTLINRLKKLSRWSEFWEVLEKMPENLIDSGDLPRMLQEGRLGALISKHRSGRLNAISLLKAYLAVPSRERLKCVTTTTFILLLYDIRMTALLRTMREHAR